MINYFRTTVINLIGNKYREEYEIGLCGEDWTESTAISFIDKWTAEFNKIAKASNFDCRRFFRDTVSCSESQFNTSWVKVKNYHIS